MLGLLIAAEGHFVSSDWWRLWQLQNIVVLYMVLWVVPLNRSILLFHWVGSVVLNVSANFCQVLI